MLVLVQAPSPTPMQRAATRPNVRAICGGASRFGLLIRPERRAAAVAFATSSSPCTWVRQIEDVKLDACIGVELHRGRGTIAALNIAGFYEKKDYPKLLEGIMLLALKGGQTDKEIAEAHAQRFLAGRARTEAGREPQATPPRVPSPLGRDVEG